jgi:hypothetical protein
VSSAPVARGLTSGLVLVADEEAADEDEGDEDDVFGALWQAATSEAIAPPRARRAAWRRLSDMAREV